MNRIELKKIREKNFNFIAAKVPKSTNVSIFSIN